MHGSTYEARCLTRKENPRKWLKQNNSTKCPCFHCYVPASVGGSDSSHRRHCRQEHSRKGCWTRQMVRWSGSRPKVCADITVLWAWIWGEYFPSKRLILCRLEFKNRVRASTSLYFTLVSWHIWKERNGRGLYFNYTIRFVMMIYLRRRLYLNVVFCYVRIII